MKQLFCAVFVVYYPEPLNFCHVIAYFGCSLFFRFANGNTNHTLHELKWYASFITQKT